MAAAAFVTFGVFQPGASAYGPGGGSTTTTAPGGGGGGGSTTTTTTPGGGGGGGGSTTTTAPKTGPGSGTTTTTVAPCSTSINISISGDLVVGGTINVTISACPHSSYLVTLHSPGFVLGTITTDGQGHGFGSFRIPTNIDPGVHTLEVQGAGASNSVEFTIDPALAAASATGNSPGGASPGGGIPTAGPTPPSSGHGPLAFTGAEIALLAALAALLVAVGGMLVLAARQRRRGHLRAVPYP